MPLGWSCTALGIFRERGQGRAGDGRTAERAKQSARGIRRLARAFSFQLGSPGDIPSTGNTPVLPSTCFIRQSDCSKSDQINQIRSCCNTEIVWRIHHRANTTSRESSSRPSTTTDCIFDIGYFPARVGSAQLQLVPSQASLWADCLFPSSPAISLGGSAQRQNPSSPHVSVCPFSIRPRLPCPPYNTCCIQLSIDARWWSGVSGVERDYNTTCCI